VSHTAADAHEFSATVLNGNGGTYNSTDEAGKALVLEFYFDSCPYCNENAPNVDPLATAYPGQVVEVTVDCRQSEWNDWISNHHPVAQMLNDCSNTLSSYYGVDSFPTVIALDSTHAQTFSYVGVWDESTTDQLKAILAGQ
jgi:thiol-disulfide isomerase/thioredoxin